MKKIISPIICRAAVLCLVAAGLFSSVVTAQSSDATGSIIGKVVDSETGEAIVGANIALSGLDKGAATDLEGNYAIGGLAPGGYSISVSYISYGKKTISDIEVASDTPATINVELQPATVGMEEVMVTASASTGSEAGLLSIQRKAVPVQDGLSSEFLNKTGDSNAAGALKRVTGVSLMGDNEVYVRGLGNRYSNIQLNGSEVPSTDPTTKKAPVDLVGSGLVDNIAVQKTFTPEQSGEFSGGSVHITTRSFPESRNLSIGYSSELHSNSGLGNTLRTKGGSTDFLGYDDGKRQLPNLLQSERLTLGDRESQAADRLHNDWNIATSGQAIPSQKITFNYADQFNESTMPVGLVSSFSYKYDRHFKPDEYIFKIQSSAGNGSVIPNSDFRMDSGVEAADLSSMLNLSIKPDNKTKISLKNLYSNSLENSTSVITGEYINYDKYKVRQTISDFDRRTMFSSGLEVETYFEDFLKSALTANVNYSTTQRDQPDRRATQYNRDTTQTDSSYGIYFDDGGNNHYFAEQTDHNYSAKLGYEMQITDFLTLETGGSYVIKSRDFSARRFKYDAYNYNSTEFEAYPRELRTEEPEIALAEDLVAQNQLQLSETTQLRDSYTGEQLLRAGYLNSDWTMNSNLSLQLGARLEHSAQSVSYKDNSSNHQIAEIENIDLLPAVNLTYHLTEATNLRGAFSRTLARPDFREISEFRFQDFLGGEILYGNPDLKRTAIRNYDLRLETYPNPGELLAVSAYYKTFDNPIEKVYRVTERLEVKYENAEQAMLFGVEIEGRKNITPSLQMVANGSYIFSETTVRDDLAANVANISRTMYGQSPYTVNLGAFYTVPGSNLTLSTNYNTFGRRIVTVGMNRQPGDEFEQPFHKIDFSAEYLLNNFSLNFGIENMLNRNVEYRQGPVTTYRYAPGITFDFGIKMMF